MTTQANDTTLFTVSHANPNTPSSPTFGLQAPPRTVQIQSFEARYGGDPAQKYVCGTRRVQELAELDGEDSRFLPPELPADSLRRRDAATPLGIQEMEGDIRATLSATSTEKYRGIHAVSWGVYE